MNILVFGGSGKMGATVAWDLVKANDVGVVGLIDRRTLAGVLTRRVLETCMEASEQS
jgi:nucleoside-diphosphate-sugar epimerase